VRRKAEGVRRENTMIFKSKLGWAGVAASEKGITMIALPRKSKRAAQQELDSAKAPLTPALSRVGRGSVKMLEKAAKLLQRYFSGESVSFDVPLDVRYHTAFQQAVWKAAAEIPYGEARSYAWIAKRIRKPLAVRAVGNALGANPLPIILPCHRVISSAGTLGGFSGGLGMKRKLLELEQQRKNIQYADVRRKGGLR
jgi:methylated-DNA-[protein]-cysteine S-methyltransferase